MGRLAGQSSHPILYGSTPCEPFALRLISLPASFGLRTTEDTQDNVADRLVKGASIQKLKYCHR